MSGGLALLRAIGQWKIEHHVSRLLLFLFHSFLVTIGVVKVPCPPQISSISCHVVLLRAVSRTKYCC